MNKFYMLLKNKMIDFNSLIIDKYSFLGLDEADVIILIKLNKLYVENKKFSAENIAKGMSITEEVVRNKLVSLINNQYITLTLSGTTEIYDLDDTYKRLSQLLEQEVDNNSQEVNEMMKIVAVIEKEFQKSLSPIELETVNNWIYVQKYSYDSIYNALLESLKHSKKSLKYVEMFLNKKDKPQYNQTNQEIQQLFNTVWKK